MVRFWGHRQHCFGLKSSWAASIQPSLAVRSSLIWLNQGEIGVIVARRKQDELSGHIVIVVPEIRRACRGVAAAVKLTQAWSEPLRLDHLALRN
jgi:hypothetical protein